MLCVCVCVLDSVLNVVCDVELVKPEDFFFSENVTASMASAYETKMDIEGPPVKVVP